MTLLLSERIVRCSTDIKPFFADCVLLRYLRHVFITNSGAASLEQLLSGEFYFSCIVVAKIHYNSFPIARP